MGLPTTIVLRYLNLRGRMYIANKIIMLAIAGLTISVAALFLASFAYSGLEKLIIDSCKVSSPDIALRATKGSFFSLSDIDVKKIQAIDGIKKIFKILEVDAIAQRGDLNTIVTVKGIDRYDDFLDFFNRYLYHSIKNDDKNIKAAVIGIGIASKLAVSARYQPLKIYTKNNETKMLRGISAMNRVNLEVVNLFSIDANSDEKFIFVTLDIVQNNILRKKVLSSVDIYLNDEKKKNSVIHSLNQNIDTSVITIQKFEEMQSELIRSLKKEKILTKIVFVFMILLSLINLISCNYAIFYTKKHEIEILIAMGLSTIQHFRIFLYTSSIIGISSILFGNCLALLIGAVQKYFKVIPLGATINLTDHYPLAIDLDDMVVLNCILLTTLAIVGAFSSWQISYNKKV